MIKHLKTRIVVSCIVILILSGCVFVGIPFLNRALLKPEPRLCDNGYLIYRDIMCQSQEATNWTDTIWCKISKYKTSTDFFRTMVTNGWLSVSNFSYFYWKGLKPPSGTFGPNSFCAENNDWCIVSGLNSNTSPDTPCLFSRNVGFGANLEPPRTGVTLDQMTGMCKSKTPLQNKNIAVITYGGTVKSLPAKYATQTNFNPTGASLPILAP